MPGSCPDGVSVAACMPTYQRDANTLAAWVSPVLSVLRLASAHGNASRTTISPLTARVTVFSQGADAVKLDWCKFATVPGHTPNVTALTEAFGFALEQTGRQMFFNFHCRPTRKSQPYCSLTSCALPSVRAGGVRRADGDSSSPNTLP